MKKCNQKFLMVGGAPHKEDAALGNRVVIQKCKRCGQTYYALPTSIWVEEVEAAEFYRKCLSSGIRG